MAQGSFDCETDKSSRSEKQGIVIRRLRVEARRSTDKRYPGDNRLIFPRVHIDGGLAPRCRLIASWG